MVNVVEALVVGLVVEAFVVELGTFVLEAGAALANRVLLEEELTICVVVAVSADTEITAVKGASQVLIFWQDVRTESGIMLLHILSSTSCE